MSNVQSQIDRIRNNIEAAYIALEALGVDVPADATVDELAALINDAAAAHLDDVIAKRILQTTGTATDKVMSQKAATEAVSDTVRYVAQTLTEAQKAQARANIGIAAYLNEKLSLAVGDDGLVYIMFNGAIVGSGVEVGSGGAISGYVDENNNIIVSGDLPDGTYSVKYETADGTIDIGDLVIDSNTYYTVTANLTNCTSNGAAQAVEGGSYTATITANSGYELKSLTVTMGGSDVTASAVSGGAISIASVTGDVVITAVAEEQVVEADPTNFISVGGDGWITGGRLNASGAERTDGGPDCVLSNYIAVQSGDVVYIENADVYSNLYSAVYKADKTVISAFLQAGSSDVTANSTTSGQQQYTIVNANAGYVRLCLKPSSAILTNSAGANATAKYDCTQIVIKIKRNGTWL